MMPNSGERKWVDGVVAGGDFDLAEKSGVGAGGGVSQESAHFPGGYENVSSLYQSIM